MRTSLHSSHDIRSKQHQQLRNHLIKKFVDHVSFPSWSTYVALNAIFDISEVTAFNLDQVLVENYNSN